MQNSAITRSQLRGYNTSHGQRVAGAIPDLRPSLDSERTTLITGVFKAPTKDKRKNVLQTITHTDINGN